MLFLSRPNEERIRALIAKQETETLSYPNEGATRGEFPPGYAVLRARVELGRGCEAYRRAQQAMLDWKMFAVPNVRLYPPKAAIAPGTVVAGAVSHFGFWSLNFCRVVYVVDEESPVARYGFAYGTLRDHFESGEERFLVEWDRSTSSVFYELASFSKPGKLATWLAAPVARRLQRRFLKNSLNAMKLAIKSAA